MVVCAVVVVAVYASICEYVFVTTHVYALVQTGKPVDVGTCVFEKFLYTNSFVEVYKFIIVTVYTVIRS